MDDHLKYVALALAIHSIAYVASEGTRSAFLIIDVQDCFLPGGSLPVDRGDTVIPTINSIRNSNTFDVVIFSLDWHPPGHVSFASAHSKSPFDVVTLHYLVPEPHAVRSGFRSRYDGITSRTPNAFLATAPLGTLCLGGTVTSKAFPGAVDCSGSQTKTLNQTLYPDHCVQNVTQGPTSSLIARDLVRNNDDLLIYKGDRKQIDSYSAFVDNGKFFHTFLDSELKKRKISIVFIAGFALDICVFHTSMDAKDLGYYVYVVTDASLGVNPQDVVNAEEKLKARGVKLISSDEIPSILQAQNYSTFPSPALTMMLVLLLTATQFSGC